MGISGPQRDISPYISNAKAWPTRPFTLACLWPVASKDVYSNRGQVQHYMDVFGASLVLIIFTMDVDLCYFMESDPMPVKTAGTWML